MPASKKANKTIILKTQLLLCVFALVLLALSALNINRLFEPQKTKVLGTNTKVPEAEFWQTFLRDNKYYLPGWVEIGRIDIATQINPHYFTR